MTSLTKFQQLGDWDRMHCEQINATRLIKQLKALIYEMDMLRSQVQDSDLQMFDRLTDQARKNAQDAIEEYLVLNPQSQKPVWVTSQNDISANNIENITQDREEEEEEEEETLLKQMPGLHVQITSSISSEELEKQEQCLKSWENLQAEVQDIHQLFEDFSLMVQEQKEKTDEVENNVEVAADSVEKGTSHLARAARYKATMYPIAGALLGGCLGGPIGLIAGIKLGGLAALGCGVIGFTGGQLLKKKQQAEESKSDVELINIQQSYNLKGSVSLPHIGDTRNVPHCSTEIPTTK